jgi:hypothetical protein
MKAVKAREEMEKQKKVQEEFDKYFQKQNESRQKSIENLDQEIKKQKDHNATIGMSVKALQAYEQAQLDAALALRIHVLEIMKAENVNQVAIELYEKETEKLKELTRLRREGIFKDEQFAQVKKMQSEFDKLWDDVSEGLLDALMRGFEGGESVGKNFINAVKNMFKSMTLRVFVQPVMREGLGLVTQMLGGNPGTTAGMVGNGVNMMGTAGTAAGMGGMAFSGAGVAQGWGIAMQNIGTAGYFGAAGTTLSGAGSAAASGSLGSAAGMALPYIGIAAAVIAVLTKIHSNGGHPAVQNLSLLSGSGQSVPNNGFYPTPNLGQTGPYDEVLKGAIAVINSSAAQLGGSANQSLRYGMFSSISPDGKGGQTVANVVGADGNRLYDYNVNGPNASVVDRLNAQVPALILTGLQNSNLSAEFKTYFNTLSAATVTQEQLTAALATAGAVKDLNTAIAELGGTFASVAGLSVEAKAELISFAGGLENLTKGISQYITDYYDSGEQAEIYAKRISSALADLGLGGRDLTTREDFRALVESRDVNTSQGREQLATLLEIAPYFSQLADYLAENGGSLQSTVGDQAFLDSLLGSNSKNVLDAQTQMTAGISDVTFAVNGVTDAINSMSDRLAALLNGGSTSTTVSTQPSSPPTYTELTYGYRSGNDN